MAAEEKEEGWTLKEHGGAEVAGEKAAGELLDQQLGKLASSFKTEFIEAFVKWLKLPHAVLLAMTAFVSGLGGEGMETFAQMLLKDPILKENSSGITQDFLSFSLWNGYYNA